jgi:DNA-binding response OmpR family regulator
MDKKYTILIVDDRAENLQYLHTILTQEGYEIRATTDGNMAYEAAKENKPDLILLDIKMPGIDGFEVCQKLKKEESLREIPVIFISALDEIEHKVRAFEEGGVDYITKPFEPKEVLSRVKTRLQIHKSKLKISRLLEQQDMFVKKIMHEINTPLSIIALNANSIERKFGSLQEIESIKASSKTLSSIYGDLSYIVKKEKIEYETTKVDLIAFLSKRVRFFDEMTNIKDISISLEVQEETEVFINEYELERIIDNTLSNAIKYSNPSSQIEILLYKQKDETYLDIIDKGLGMKNVDFAFTPYYQQSHKNIGLGLGLSIVKEICDKYSIKITVESKEKVGTKFSYNITSIRAQR